MKPRKLSRKKGKSRSTTPTATRRPKKEQAAYNGREVQKHRGGVPGVASSDDLDEETHSEVNESESGDNEDAALDEWESRE